MKTTNNRAKSRQPTTNNRQPKIKLGPRSRAMLTDEETAFLKEYINVLDPMAAYINIRKNAGVSRDTLLILFENGYGFLSVVEKLQKFIKNFRETDYYQNLKKLQQ